MQILRVLDPNAPWRGDKVQFPVSEDFQMPPTHTNHTHQCIDHCVNEREKWEDVRGAWKKSALPRVKWNGKIRRYHGTFLATGTQLRAKEQGSSRVVPRGKHHVTGNISFIAPKAHYMFCHSVTRAPQLRAVPVLAHERDPRLLKTRHLTTRTPVYTVVKRRTCRRAIIVTIRDRIVTS